MITHTKCVPWNAIRFDLTPVTREQEGKKSDGVRRVNRSCLPHIYSFLCLECVVLDSRYPSYGRYLDDVAS
jgi:hypothetical protein